MLVDKIFKFLKKEFFQREEGKIKTVAREFFFFFFFFWTQKQNYMFCGTIWSTAYLHFFLQREKKGLFPSQRVLFFNIQIKIRPKLLTTYHAMRFLWGKIHRNFWLGARKRIKTIFLIKNCNINSAIERNAIGMYCLKKSLEKLFFRATVFTQHWSFFV